MEQFADSAALDVWAPPAASGPDGQELSDVVAPGEVMSEKDQYHRDRLRASLRDELDDWIRVFEDSAEGQPISEATRHLDKDSEELVGSYNDTYFTALTVAKG